MAVFQLETRGYVMKTFAQWSKDNDFKFSAYYAHSIKSVQIFPNSQADVPGLFRLSDYVVLSALSGPSYMLVPRIVPPVTTPSEVTP